MDVNDYVREAKLELNDSENYKVFAKDHTTTNNDLVNETIDRPISLNPHTKLDFSSDKPYLYCILPRNILDKSTIIRDLFRFL